MTKAGTTVGSYRILSTLGEGGMGMVYLAQHVTIERRVALKVLQPELCTRPEPLRRFFVEALATNRIRHEHIVEITDFGTTPDEQSYLVMEFLDGETLAARLSKQGGLPLDQGLHIAIQIAGAVAASHAVGIIHRDLKPENVFLINRGGDPDYVKLVDFGLAKLLDESGGPQERRTLTGQVVGTPYYMSPEQCHGKKVDPRTDIYALGVMLFELFSGEVPFDGGSWTHLLLLHTTAAFPSLRKLKPDLPEALEALIGRAVVKNRLKRTQTMEELRDELRALREA